MYELKLVKNYLRYSIYDSVIQCYDDSMIEEHGGDHQQPDYGSMAKDDYAHVDSGSRMTPSPTTRQANDPPRASAAEALAKRTRLGQ